ncbi:hypothetical protein U472_00785 [Orenia metallireducens]|uniref:M23ase beta-sheet core domain-containing protein n=1 Tax=Orenia metallireducens TaxID=1413210 RepID=A0A1C0ACU8_9FIRM|nr:M23 family metallopeptidase [Orenia metallireducens]OCL28454.1 hypothetical protein U472_00785 [Orenia metallireducens]
MSYHKGKRKITLTIVPHTDGDIRTLRISKSSIKFIFLCIIISVITVLGFLWYYYGEYSQAQHEINDLLPYKERNQVLKEEKEYYEQRLSEFIDEIEKINNEFGDIITEKQEIRELINGKDNISQNNEMQTDMSNNIGYYDFENSEDKGNDMIQYIEANLVMLKEVMPKQKEDLSNLKQKVVEHNRFIEAKPQGWPIRSGKGRVTSPFGYRYHPVLKKRLFHDGIDIGVWYNHKVIATGKGRVIFAGDQNDGYGRKVIIDHGYGYRTLYAHTNRVLVKRGQWVARGDIIALSGNSGRSTGPHLHYEVQYKGKVVNPMDYIK